MTQHSQCTQNWRDRNPDCRFIERIRKYGFDNSDKEWAKNQLENGCCEICGARGDLHFDHDHQTKAFRGFLCHRCNIGLGHFRDDPKLLEMAIAYLRVC
jgi:hypothetical protein